MIFQDLKKLVSAKYAALKSAFSDEHKLYRLAFAEISVDQQWEQVIFSDKSTFSSANNGPGIVYRPRKHCWPPHAMVVCPSVHCWGWISLRGAGVLHCIEEHLVSLLYKHILEHVMVPCVRVLYPDGVIQFQQDLSSGNDSCVVQELLAQQAIFELTGWPPQATYMNPIKNMLSEVKKKIFAGNLA
jgi:hypothetical protein